VTLQARAHLSNGTTQDVTSATQWTLSNATLATLSNGVLTSKAPGTLTVQAAYVMTAPVGQSSSTTGVTPQTLSSSAQVTVTAPGTTVATPSITWSTPHAIQYGTTLGSASLDATASVPGSFTYMPAAGTLLKAGNQTLTATFTPSDATADSAATAAVQLTVTPASPVITWAPPSPVQQGTAISATQLNATANVPGTFSYSPAAGAVVAVGTQPLTATFTPTDTTDYVPATAHNSLIVDVSDTGKSTPIVTWPTPAAIQYGAALNSIQLDATASVPGSLAYTPAAGTMLKAGTQTLTATFTPSETTTYSTTTATVQLTVKQATPAITWAPLAAITRGAALKAAQLDATANVPGTFSYNPGAGYVPPGGTLQLTATFTPTDSNDYTSATVHNSLTIGAENTAKSTPSISWSEPAAISYGTVLSSVQLNATANVSGAFRYTPAAGTVLKAGTQTLAATFTPSETTTYSTTTATVQLTVKQATPATTWAPLAAISHGTALSSTQLDATASVPGTFSYSLGAGNVPAAGTLQLAATFTPSDTTDYTSATAHNSLAVSPNNPTPPPNPANCTTLSPGAGQSTIQSALNSCGSGNTVAFSAGTYGPITSTVTVPCGVSMTGPTVTYSQTPNQTAIINGSSSFSGSAFQTTSGCSASQTIEYVQWNGEHSNTKTNGGGFLLVNAGTTNLTVTNNYLHGADTVGADQGGCCTGASSQIYFTGSGTTSNVNITWNQLGGTSFGDCSGAFADSGPSEESGGSICHGVGIANSINNVNITNNNLTYLEEPMKVYSTASSCTNTNVNQNHFNQDWRIDLETQCYTGNSVSMNVQYNDTIAKYSTTNIQNDNWSIANGCTNSISSTCITHNDYNVILETSSCCDTGNEIWGGGASNPATTYAKSTTTNYNLYQGYLYDAITWSAAGNLILDNNTFNIVNNGTNTSCTAHAGGFWNWNTNGGSDVPVYTPTCTGNTFSNNITGTYPSATPTISPGSGTFSSSQTVTITNTGTNRDTNTTDWCTTDGSTPTPGSGTAVPYYNGGTFNVTATTTVKCVGLWGALNQPYSYPSGYGYVPSAVVSSSLTAAVASARVSKTSPSEGASQTASSISRQAVPAGMSPVAAPTLQSVTITPSRPAVSIGGTTQLKATATFSDGSVKDITSEVAWQSSDPRTITTSAAGILSGLATGPAAISGSYQGIQASASATSSIGEVNWSGPIVITEAGTYSGNWQSTDSKTPAVTVATSAPVVIENAHISSVAGLIKTSVAGADLTVRNSVGVAAKPAVKGQSNGVFLDASSPTRLDVENNYVENAGGGVLVHGYSGNRDGQQTIVIRANRARNLNGLLSDGNGGYLPGVGSNRSVSHFIELDRVQAVPGIDVGWNEVINYPGRSLVADNIAIKSSSGTPNQPLEIHDTYIQGAYPYTAAQADYQGGGIKTVGSPDDSAQQATAFNSIHDNQVVGTVNYGIEFTAGHDNIAASNRVISSGMLADGTRIAAQRVGMANGDVNGASVANASMYNNTMHDNLIGWACWTSSCAQSGYRKDQSFPASPGDYSTNSVLPPQPITPEMENNEYQIWLNKTASAGIAVGPAF
jgi:Big-like domain-containing protein